MLKAIIPAFLKKIDHLLLVKKPVIWISKIHFVIWYSLLLAILAGLLGAFVSYDLTKRIHFDSWYSLLGIISFIFICIWAYSYIIFNKEKHFGLNKPYEAYGNFTLVFFIVTIFALTPYPFEYALNHRIANSFADKEIIEDINTLNETYSYIFTSDDKYFQIYDSIHDKSYFSLRSLNNEQNPSEFTPSWRG